MSIQKRGNKYYVRVRYLGHETRRVIGTQKPTKAQTKELEDEIRSALIQQHSKASTPQTLSEAFEVYCNGRAKDLANYDKFISHVRSIRPFLQGYKLIDAPTVAESMVKSYRARSLKPSSINRRLAILKRVSNLSFKWGWIDVKIGDRIELLPDKSRREVALSPAEVETLANHCIEEETGNIVRFLAYTGLRMGEAFQLEARNRPSRSSLVIPASITKTNKDRYVPLHVKAQPLVLPIKQKRRAFEHRFKRARERAGMEHVCLHDLRHTFASWMANASTDMQTLQKLLGHATPAMTARYSHLADKKLIDAVKTLETWMDNESKNSNS